MIDLDIPIDVLREHLRKSNYEIVDAKDIEKIKKWDSIYSENSMRDIADKIRKEHNHDGTGDERCGKCGIKYRQMNEFLSATKEFVKEGESPDGLYKSVLCKDSKYPFNDSLEKEIFIPIQNQKSLDEKHNTLYQKYKSQLDEIQKLKELADKRYKFLDGIYTNQKTEIEQLKEELHQLLNNPDFAHQKNCGVCGELVSKATDEISAINVKGARLVWLCNDCETLKQELQQLKDGLKYIHDKNRELLEKGEDWGTKYLKLEQDSKTNADIIEKMSIELKKRIDEETAHLNHPKQIYKTVEHNCKYNLRVCEILQSILKETK